MQQRQLRLGDTLDDYCPRERRVTNHAVVAMVGDEVKQTRCTTCDAEHEYRHAKVPRQRRKNEAPAALFATVAAGAPRRVASDSDLISSNGDNGESLDHESSADHLEETSTAAPDPAPLAPIAAASIETPADVALDDEEESGNAVNEDEGPIHRRLIRASLPRPEGQQPPARPIPEFTIRQPGGRPNRFRPRHQRGGQGQQFFGNRSNGNNGGGLMRGGGRPGMMNRRGQGGGGRKRSK